MPGRRLIKVSTYSRRSLRVGFAGTPEFAARSLQAIIDAGFPVLLVITQPDRPKGRGLKIEASPTAWLAVTHALAVHKPATLESEADRADLLVVPIDVLVVAAYGLIVPPAVLAWPVHGCLNVHASRLPRWRGAAPIQRAIEAGDTETGVTIMQMDAGLDTGPMIATADVPIAPRETAASLHDWLAMAGAIAIVAALDRLERDGRLESTPQPQEGVTYARKIGSDEMALDWAHDAARLDRKIRALDPAPGATATLDGGTLKLWSALPLARSAAAEPGTILAADARGIDVACGNAPDGGTLRILELQPAGGKRMPASAFLAGRSIAPGMRFVATPPRVVSKVGAG